MSDGPSRPVDRIRALVAHAAAEGAEAEIARKKAREALAALDSERLDTLAGQRQQLIEALQEESRRLFSSNERATKQETGELVSSALVLLRHYERIDALIPAVLLMRIEAGHRLTNDERQQLDGPVESWLDRWFREGRERRAAERKAKRAERRAERKAAAR